MMIRYVVLLSCIAPFAFGHKVLRSFELGTAVPFDQVAAVLQQEGDLTNVDLSDTKVAGKLMYLLSVVWPRCAQQQAARFIYHVLREGLKDTAQFKDVFQLYDEQISYDASFGEYEPQPVEFSLQKPSAGMVELSVVVALLFLSGYTVRWLTEREE